MSLILETDNWTNTLDLEKTFGDYPEHLEIDIGCGKGRFLIERATSYPQMFFIGIDKRQQRARKVERKASRLNLANIRLVCAEAYSVITILLPKSSVSTYYLFFPDPWPKRRHHHRRLFDKGFMEALVHTLTEKGRIHIITDHRDYFNVIHDILSSDSRFTETPPFIPEKAERTEFQEVFIKQNTPIHCCSFVKTESEVK